jgi:hypothetical protein
MGKFQTVIESFCELELAYKLEKALNNVSNEVLRQCSHKNQPKTIFHYKSSAYPKRKSLFMSFSNMKPQLRVSISILLTLANPPNILTPENTNKLSYLELFPFQIPINNL